MSQSQSTQEQPVGMGFLRRLVAYAEEVYGLKKLLDEFSDGRRDPRVPPSVVAAVVLFCGLLRIRSFNALEPKLAKASFQRLVDQPMPKVDGVVQKLCSVDTLGRALCVADLTKARAISWGILSKAERNKVFREGWVGALRYFAIDGWEPFCSCERCCDHCLIRKVKVEREGQVIEVDQYYHRYVVAMLVDERLDLVLDFEPLLPSDLRPDKSDKHEGEQTAALRLLPRLKKKFAWLDAVIADALFANGPFLTAVEALRMSALIVAKKSGEEPLKEALWIWDGQPPSQVVEEARAAERIELWDCPRLTTLQSFKGPIRVVRGRVTDLRAPTALPRTWCVLVTGQAARKLSGRQVIKIIRSRWHIENTAFHQWTTRWRLGHVFIHDGTAIQALFWLFFAAFNLLTLFLYRQLRSFGRDRGKDVTKTISALVDELLDDLATLTTSPWSTAT